MSSLGSDGAVFGLGKTSRPGDANPVLQTLSGACRLQMGIAFGAFKTLHEAKRASWKTLKVLAFARADA
jgi:hypothetical protein